MFISKHYKLQGRSSNKALVVTIPANVVQTFNLTKASRLKMSYQGDKLIIDLLSGSPSEPAALAHVEAA
jgi:antitoxin component of MazEF toxin-antitoxin module